MKDIWKPKHPVWFKKNDDDNLGKKNKDVKTLKALFEDAKSHSGNWKTQTGDAGNVDLD